MERVQLVGGQFCVQQRQFGRSLVDIERGEVIGVVSSKLAPLPKEVESALADLKNQKSNFVFERKLQDGTRVTMSEGQVIEFVLEYLKVRPSWSLDMRLRLSI